MTDIEGGAEADDLGSHNAKNEVNGKDEPGSPDASSAQSHEGFVTDPELALFLIRGAYVLGEQGLDRVLGANQKFNTPREIRKQDGSWVTDDNYQAKKILKEIPSLMEAAEAVHIEPEQMEHVLVHTINAFDSEQRRIETDIHLLTKGLKVSADREEEVTGDDIQKIESLITTGGEHEQVSRTLEAFVNARTVGLTLDDSVGMVSDFLHADHAVDTGYAMPHFSNALKALRFTGVDPEVVRETFQAILRIPYGERDEAYDDLRQAIAFGCPVRKMKPEALLRAINQQVTSGMTTVDAINRIFGDAHLLEDTNAEPRIFIPAAERDAYFVDKPGNLDYAVLPYRTERSFNDGLKDLEGLARARADLGDEVGEGNWVFDPETQRWYSLGGETTYLGGGRVQHRSFLYDISQLSEHPISLHIHPNEYAIGEEEKYGFVFPTDADYRAIATMMEETSRRVKPRSLIVHPLGTTEFVYPDDIEQIKNMAETIEQVRDRFFSRFPDGIQAIADSIGQYGFSELAVREINNELPEGFSIILHPPGTELE